MNRRPVESLLALCSILCAILAFPQTQQQPKGESIPTGETIVIQTKHGTMRVKNFYKSSPFLGDKGYAFLVGPTATQGYTIAYSGPSESLFYIQPDIHDPNVVRRRAEAELLKILGISKQQACTLRVQVGFAGVHDPAFAGKNFGLSFCPDGKPIPELK